ncbi:16676_t:CDS:2 [Entrophospora sp. SA101]|nr:16676_t:CDS:2 [Entrophospora sp. SA101]
MATTNTTTVKNTPEDKQKKNEKRAKRNSFKRIKKEGEIFVKSLFGKEKTDKSNNKKQDFVPPSPRTKYGKTRGNDDQQRVNTYPVSDDDNLKSKTKARNRLSINLADLIKSDDDKKEMEKRRRTFHFTDSHKDIDFAVDNINDNSSSDPKNVPTIKTNLNPILSTTQYDSPIVETLHISSAFSPITNMSNKDEKTIIQNDNLITPVQNLARESTNDDSQRSLQQSRFTDDSSRISTFFSDFFNFNFFSDNTESSPTTTSSLYKEHPCRYIGG